MFYERLNTLCKMNGTNITDVAVNQLGVGNSAPTAWKKGAEPRIGVVIRAAQYFHVSADYLLGLTDSPQPAGEASALSALADAPDLQELLLPLCQADSPARKAAIAAAHAVLDSLSR